MNVNPRQLGMQLYKVGTILCKAVSIFLDVDDISGQKISNNIRDRGRMTSTAKRRYRPVNSARNEGFRLDTSSRQT